MNMRLLQPISRVSLAAALCVGMPSRSQQPNPSPPAPQPVRPATYRISGKVVDAHTGAPLGKASVRTADVKERSDSITVIADDDGSFSFDGLRQGKYSLTAERRGYIEQSYEEHDQFSTAIA